MVLVLSVPSTLTDDIGDDVYVNDEGVFTLIDGTVKNECESPPL